METLNSLVSSAAVYLLNLKYLILVGAAGSTLSDFINRVCHRARLTSKGSIAPAGLDLATLGRCFGR